MVQPSLWASNQVRQRDAGSLSVGCTHIVYFWASEAQPLTKLKALGFMGIMGEGGHHQQHHLMMAMGQFDMHRAR